MPRHDRVARLVARARDPGLPPWRRRWAARRLGHTTGSQAAAALAGMVAEGSPPDVLAVVRPRLAAVVQPEAVDAVCRVWDETGSVPLGALIAESGWVASAPAALRVRTALHVDRPDVLADDGPEVARALIEVAGRGGGLAAAATAAAQALRGPQAQEAVLGEVDAAGSEVAARIALAGGFGATDAPGRRAVVLFLAGELDRYRDLDHDGRLLSAALATAPTDLRRTIAARARRSGRVEWVQAVLGDRSGGLERVGVDEQAAVIELLVAGRRFDRLWELALAAPPVWDVRILHELGRRSWCPDDADDARTFETLVDLASRCGDPGEAAVVSEDSRALQHMTATADGWLVTGGSTGGTHGTVTVRASSGEVRAIGTVGIMRLAVSRDGGTVAVAAAEDGVRCFRLPGGDPVALTDDGTPVRASSLALSPDGAVLATAHGSAVQLWSLASGRRTRELRVDHGGDPGHTAPEEHHLRSIEQLEFGPSGTVLVGVTRGGDGHLWQLPDRRPSGRFGVGLGGPYDGRLANNCGTVSPDGTLLVTVGSSSGGVEVRRLPAGEVICWVPAHLVRSVSITPDLSLLAVGRWGGRVDVHHLPSGEHAGTVAEWVGHSCEALVAAVTNDRLAVVQTGWDVPGVDRRVRVHALWPYRAGGIATTPIGQIDVDEVDRWADGASAPPWMQLIRTLMARERRFRVEVDDPGPQVAPTGGDVELE